MGKQKGSVTNMRSDAVKTGMQQAPHRSLFNALGMTKEEMERPLVGIVSSYNEIVPGHMNLDKIVNAVKQGVAMAGGTPIMFPAIAVCDGIAMGHIGMKYSLVTRDLIADSTEAMAMAHQFDALVMVPNCDKNAQSIKTVATAASMAICTMVLTPVFLVVPAFFAVSAAFVVVLFIFFNLLSFSKGNSRFLQPDTKLCETRFARFSSYRGSRKVSCRHGLWLVARVKKPRKVNPFRGVLSVLFLS